MSNLKQKNALVWAVAAVFGMGGYVGHLYSSSIATFGMMAILLLGTAIVRMTDQRGVVH